MACILESKRLLLRKLTIDDYKYLRVIMQDIEIMYAWEHAFTDEEILTWIKENIRRYQQNGFSFFAAVEKSTQNFIGVIGPLVEEIANIPHVGIAYILDKKYWGQGFAVEGARASMEYAFTKLNADQVIAQIRPNNFASRHVAEQLGMSIEFEHIKNYRGQALPHLVYSKLKNKEET